MTSARYNIPGKHPINTAAALHTVGFAVSISVEKDTGSQGKTTSRWYVSERPKDAADLIAGRAKSEAMRGTLEKFQVCTLALAIRANLDVWFRSGADWYEMTGQERPYFAGDSDSVLIRPTTFDFLAAAMIAGCALSPRPVDSSAGRMAAISKVGSHGVIIAELICAYEAANKRRGKGGVAAPITLPGYPAEEHPFLYAVEALEQVNALRAIEDATTKNPTCMFRGTGGGRGRSALVSESLLNGRDQEILEQHLTGQI